MYSMNDAFSWRILLIWNKHILIICWDSAYSPDWIEGEEVDKVEMQLIVGVGRRQIVAMTIFIF